MTVKTRFTPTMAPTLSTEAEWSHELYSSPVDKSYAAALDQSSRARLTALLGILKTMAGR